MVQPLTTTVSARSQRVGGFLGGDRNGFVPLPATEGEKEAGFAANYLRAVLELLPSLALCAGSKIDKIRALGGHTRMMGARQ
jgi:hypothetical protein